MRQYTVEKTIVEENKVTKIFCNKCGREIQDREETFSANYEWGYFSDYDLEMHKFDLCQECYKKLISEFQIPIEKIKILE